MRLDQILKELNPNISDKVQEALEYQSEYGGRLENHLYRFGYADEDDLVKALGRQFNCPGIKVSGLDVMQEVLDIIPAEFALKKLVLPFEVTAEGNLVKIACENPAEKNLQKELQSIVQGKEIWLYVAVGSVLKSAIVRLYRGSLINNSIDETESATGKIKQLGYVISTDQKGKGIIQSLDGKESDHSPDRDSPYGLWLVSILNESARDMTMFENSLKYLGFKTILSQNVEQFIEDFLKYEPDILILNGPQDRDGIDRLIEELRSWGVELNRIPVFLLYDAATRAEHAEYLKLGIEDIVPPDNILDLLIIKINRIRQRLDEERQNRVTLMQDLGTHGTLEDMNIIDLIQALGMSKKTACLSVSAEGHNLAVFLNKGNIIYAECDDLFGADAVYKSIVWQKGIWCIEPIAEGDLPEPNISLPNDTILLEGCRLHDEQNHNGAQQSEELEIFSDI